MSALLLAMLLLGDPPAATPASPAPASPAPPASDAKRDHSLGAVAKRTPAARKKGPPAKVLTNEDLDKTRQGGAAVSVLAADGVEPAPVSGSLEGGEGRFNSETDTTDSVPQNEATWRQRADAVRTRIADSESVVTSAEHRLAELRSDVAPEDPMNPFRQQNREADIKTETERLEAARADVAAARQAFSDLEDEARRASIPPGWLREAQPR